MMLLAVVAAFAAVLLGVAAVLTVVGERHDVRLALGSLDEYDLPVDAREREMLTSLRERLVVPAVQWLAACSGRFTPAGYAAGIREKLVQAGSPASLDTDRVLALKVLGALSGPVWAWVAFRAAGLGGFYGVVVTGLLWAVSFASPDAWVRRRIETRQREIAARLPDILDLLVISVEAGLGFEQAVSRTVATVPGVLAEELGRMLQESRVGSTRAEALRALDARTKVPELRSFILAMLQADTFGVPIGRTLRAQADEMRIRRRQRAQEAAQKAPVKMLFPLIFCIFPSLFTVILGPAVLQILKSGLA